MKDHTSDEGTSKTKDGDAYRILLGQLTGASDKAPRQKTAVNIWRKSYTQEIEKEVTLRAKRDNVDKKKLAPVREKVAKEMFEKLSLEDKDKWTKRAKEDHEADIKEWKFKQETTSPPSTSPADRQRCASYFLLCAAI
jgi:hypothetical protein